MEIPSIIPARGGSKGLSRKNIRDLGGKPMIAWAIEASLKSNASRTFVSTEDEEIKDVALKYGAEIIARPKRLAGDKVLDLPVFQHAIRAMKEELNCHPDYVIHLRADIPVRSYRDINKSIDKVTKLKADGLRTMVPLEHPPHFIVFPNGDKLTTYEKNAAKYWDKQRQQLKPLYRLHGVVDITKPEFLFKGNFYGPDLTYLKLGPEQSFDIHTEMDLFIVNQLIKGGYLSKWM